MSTYNVIVLLSVIVAGGAFGGAASFIFSGGGAPAGTTSKPAEDRSWVKSLFVGVVAAFLVPLLLKVISSDLIMTVSSLKPGVGVPFEMFVMFGFCVIAGASSKAFINMLTGRVLQLANEARETSKKAEQIAKGALDDTENFIDQFTEPQALAREAANQEVLNPDEEKILRALDNPKYRFRTASGTAGEAKIDQPKVEKVLGTLREQGLVGKRTSEKFGVLWFLTSKGRERADLPKENRSKSDTP